MPIKERVLSERNFASTLQQVVAYRKELLELCTQAIEAEPKHTQSQLQVDWSLIGSIERQCDSLQKLLEELKR